MVRPHPQFMLFATQNPPGAYGGRKVRICRCTTPQTLLPFELLPPSAHHAHKCASSEMRTHNFTHSHVYFHRACIISHVHAHVHSCMHTFPIIYTHTCTTKSYIPSLMHSTQYEFVHTACLHVFPCLIDCLHTILALFSRPSLGE